MSMPCEKCGGSKSGVKASSEWLRGTVSRRRQCHSCGFRWTTVEVRREQYRRWAETEELGRELGRLREAIDRAEKLHGVLHAYSIQDGLKGRKP